MRKIDTVFVLLIFCFFATSVFLVLMLAGSTYSNITQMSSEGHNERVVMSYIRTKIRNTDDVGSIAVQDFEGISALYLVEILDGRDFVTLIYLYDGWVRELFFERGEERAPSTGVPFFETDYLSFTNVDGGLIHVGVGDRSMLLYPRSTDTGNGESWWIE